MEANTKTKLTRRRLLQLAGAAGVLSIPTFLGARLLAESSGESGPGLTPYAETGSSDARRDAIAAAPVVVLTNPRASPNFGAFLVEILRAEGILGFVQASLAELDFTSLGLHQTVLLAEGLLEADQADQLRAHVERGGRLIAMRPDPQLVNVLGLQHVPGSTEEGYLRVGDHPIAKGIASESLQFHAPADHYRLSGAEAVAWLSDGLGERTDHPAITVHEFGQGRAAMWAFDLARSVIFTRQGNPQWANMERDGVDGIRASDMFVEWIDLDRIHIPQADEQQRLLANLLDSLSQGAAPLPRLWYFPNAANSLLVATGDAHMNPPEAIEKVLRRVEQRGGTMSVYYTPQLTGTARRVLRRIQTWAAEIPILSNLTSDDATVTYANTDAWRERGHEFALHPYVEESLEAGWRTSWNAFTGLGLGRFTTARTHRVLWHGWVDTARVQAMHGVRMNVDFYHFGPAFQKPDGQWAYGYFTGSGLPMRFVDEGGRILNIYQQLTPLVDEQVLTMPWPSNPAKADLASAIDIARVLIDRAINGAFAALAAQFHVDVYDIPGPWEAEGLQWLEATLDYCVEKGVPIWSAERWTRFVEARNEAVVQDFRWDADRRRLMFNLALGAGANADFSLMLPVQHGAAKLSEVEVDGKTITTQQRAAGGVKYACASLQGGRHSLTATYTSV